MITDYSALSESQKEMLAACRYGYWLTYFQSKFYARTSAICNFLQILLGSAVVACLTQNHPMASVVGFLVMCIGALQLVIPFGQYSERAEKACSKFREFESKLANMNEQDAQKQLADIQITGVASWSGMETLAVNRVCDLHSEPERKLPTTIGAKFFNLFL